MSSYLEKVRDICMDLINESNAIIEDVRSLARIQSGLRYRETINSQSIAHVVSGLKLQGAHSYQQCWVFLPWEFHDFRFDDAQRRAPSA